MKNITHIESIKFDGVDATPFFRTEDGGMYPIEPYQQIGGNWDYVIDLVLSYPQFKTTSLYDCDVEIILASGKVIKARGIDFSDRCQAYQFYEDGSWEAVGYPASF